MYGFVIGAGSSVVTAAPAAAVAAAVFHDVLDFEVRQGFVERDGEVGAAEGREALELRLVVDDALDPAPVLLVIRTDVQLAFRQ